MKNDLTCAVVRDLLPSCVENLAAAETVQAVERHLAACPDCAARHAAMVDPELAAKLEEERRELDYLRRVKRRSRFRILAAVVCTVLVIAGGFAAKIFLIGTPIQPQTYALRHYMDEENVLHLIIDCVNSAWAYHGWKTEETDGVVEISGRSVTVSPVHKEGWGRLKVPLEGVREVRLCGDVVYQDGVVVGSAAMHRYGARTPYVGEAPALGRVAEAVGLDAQWSYTTELATGQRPYRWTIKFQDHWGDTSAGEWMRYYYGPQMLALVDNLDEVGWTYTTATSSGKTFCEGVLTLEEADAHLAELLEGSSLDGRWKELKSVKDFAATPAGMQVLYDLLWEDLETVFNSRTWIETVPSESSPDGPDFLET